jgi:hypothetical protein
MRLIRPLMLLLVITTYSYGLSAEEVGCIEEAEYQKTKGDYADTFAKYDLPTVSQEFLDAINATDDLREQLTNCQKNISDHAPKSCDALAEQYNAKRTQMNALKTRLSMALQMQEYLMTLKVKLERPICAK